MRLCLDEHYSSRIAIELRRRGHDVYAVSERPALRMLQDRELWAAIQLERRALLTEDAAGFMPLVRAAAATGEGHLGVVFSAPGSLPRVPGTIGRFVKRLHELLEEHPDGEAFRNRVVWL